MLTFILRESIELSVFIIKSAHNVAYSLYKYVYPTLSEEKLILLEMKELKQEVESLRNELRIKSEINSQNQTERTLQMPPFMTSSYINVRDEHNTPCSDEICLQ